MYPHTIEGLFEAVVKGTLSDVEEVVKSGKVEVNQLHNNKHIITVLLNSNYSQQQQGEKIDFLIKSGARLQFDDTCNALMRICNLKNLELQKTLVKLIKEAESFKNKYTPYHFAALEGIAPKTAEKAFAKDYFGLYPIYYAVSKGTTNESWFENIEYDFFTPIENGLYEGINLFWWSVGSPHRYLKLKQLLENFPADNYFKLLKSTPLNPDHLSHGTTVVCLLLLNKRYEDFTRLTQNLTAEQRYEILKSAPLNSEHEYYVTTTAWQLLDHVRYADFTRLTQNLTGEQSYEILKSAPLNSGHEYHGITTALMLLNNNRNEDFTRLTLNLTVEQSYEILKSAPLNQNYLHHGMTVAWVLLNHNRYENFTRLTLNLTAAQSYEILKSAPLNSGHECHGITTAWMLLNNNRNEDFTRLTQNLTAAQSYEILKSAPLNQNYLRHGMTTAWLLLSRNQYEDFTRLTQNLPAEQCYELLKSAPLNPNHLDHGNTVAHLLLVNKRYEEFTRVTQNLTGEQLYEILKSEPLNTKNSNHGMTIARMLLNQKHFEDAAKLMQKLSAQQRYELLKLQPLKAQNSLYIMLLVELLEARCYTEFEMIINGLNIDQLMELLLEANIENQQKLKNLNLLKYVAKENECLLIKILEPYEINDLLEKVYKKLRKDNTAYNPVCYVLLQKTNIALRELMQSSNDRFNEEKEFVNQSIKKYLKVLFDLYEQLVANEKYKNRASEIVGMTVNEASQLWCRDIFIEYFNDINNADYLHIETIDPLHALEGYGHYLKVLGCDDRDLARQLGVEYAQSKSGKNKSEKNKEPAKSPDPKIKSADVNDAEELALLKRKVIELEEKLKEYEGKHTLKDSASEKNNKPKSIGGDPRLFAPRASYTNSGLESKRKRDAVTEQVPKQARASDEPVANINVR